MYDRDYPNNIAPRTHAKKTLTFFLSLFFFVQQYTLLTPRGSSLTSATLAPRTGLFDLDLLDWFPHYGIWYHSERTSLGSQVRGERFNKGAKFLDIAAFSMNWNIHLDKSCAPTTRIGGIEELHKTFLVERVTEKLDNHLTKVHRHLQLLYYG